MVLLEVMLANISGGIIMKKILCFFLVLLLVLSSSLSVFATNDTNPGEEKLAVTMNGDESFFSDKLPKCGDVSPDSIPKYLKDNAKTIGLPENGDFSYKKMTKDELGIKHLRYAQMYNGIPVYGKEIIVDVKGGEIQSIQGMVSSNISLKKAVVSSTIGEDKVKGIAAAYLDIKPAEIKQSSQAYDKMSMAGSEVGDPELIWLDNDNTQILTYSINVFSMKPKLINKTLFIDAATGKIVKELENIKTEAVTKTGRGVLNDSKTVKLYQNSGYYFFKDITRDSSGSTNTVLTYDYNVQDLEGYVYLMYDTNGTLCENNSEFLSQRAGVDAHVYLAQAYQYYKDVFNRVSYNGAGANIRSIVHFQEYYGYPWANAAWAGNAAGIFLIGDGDGFPGYQDEVYEFSAALDVLGHEYTHAVIDNNGSGGLTYENQSGAMNESFADLFGQIIERKYKRDTDWVMGEDMSKGGSDSYKRSMSNPGLYGQPDNMSEYVTTTQDNGGVHTNSGIPNKAAYLIASQLGDDKTANIYYYALMHKLTSEATFLSLRRAIISSAAALYPGAGYDSVAANAFDQVGVTDGMTITTIKTNLASPQPAGTKIRWTTTVSGGNAPVYYYKIYKGSTVVSQSSAYSTNNYFDWTPTAAGTDYRALVYVKENGASDSTAVTKYSSYYTISAPIAITSLTPDKASPQLAGTKIRWTCRITGGTAPVYYYKIYKGSSVVSQSSDYSTNNYFDWTPTAAGTDYRALVYVKESTASYTTRLEKYSSYYTVAAPIAITSLTPDKASPQSTGTKIRWTCRITGGKAPVYYYKIYKGSTVVAQSSDYSANNYFDWTPTAAGTDYRALVYVKESTASYTTRLEKYSSYYTVAAPIAITSLTPDKASPQLTGTKIRWTCNITGGKAPVYYFRIYKGSTVVAQSSDYSANKYFDWTPTVAGTDYRALVYVKENGASYTTRLEKYSSYYTVSTPAPIAITSIVPDKASPQSTGTKIRWTCNITGGKAPVYYFRIYKGSILVTQSSDYSTNNYFDWTPTAAGTDYIALVYVKENGASYTTRVEKYSGYFTVTEPAPKVIETPIPDTTDPGLGAINIHDIPLVK